jgi:excisionase family DNA binding protein
VRPSALARFWGIHIKTLAAWIQQGRLAALRSPGNQLRLRVADVRAFCEREGMPIPPFVTPPPKRAVLAGLSDAGARALGRSLKSASVSLVVTDDPYSGLVATAAAPTALLVIGAAFPRFDAAAAVRAVTAVTYGPSADGLVVAVVGASTRAAAERLREAGAARVLSRGYERELPAVVRELLALDSQ